MTYLVRQGKWFHYRRWIPDMFKDLYQGRKFIWVSLKTDSEVIAGQRAQVINAELERIWHQASLDQTMDVDRSFKQAVRQARLSGFGYKSTGDIADGDVSALLTRVMQLKGLDKQGKTDIEALLGRPEQPSYPISKALDDFIKFELPNLAKKSPDQLRKWENPRKKSIANFINIVGDKDITDINRDDTLAFRAWWTERMDKEQLTPNSANKDLSYLRQVVAFAKDDKRLDINLNELFDRMRFTEQKKTRPPFKRAYIQEKLINLDHLKGLNKECQMLLFAMADTGARILELVGLDAKAGDIRLDADIPYIHIRPTADRQLKTPQSERTIPLVGSALFAFQQLPEGFKHYYCKADLISNTLNKYLREHGLLPTENHSVYSLRHSFEDRLTAVEPPDKVQAFLMGHRYVRQRYGKGPTLEQKKKWLDKIAFEVEF